MTLFLGKTAVSPVINVGKGSDATSSKYHYIMEFANDCYN